MTLTKFIRIALTPACWLRVGSYSPAWDCNLKKLMRKHKFKRCPGLPCIAKLGDVIVWVANHPYASFSLYQHECLPSRATALEAHDKMISDFTNEQPQ